MNDDSPVKNHLIRCKHVQNREKVIVVTFKENERQLIMMPQWTENKTISFMNSQKTKIQENYDKILLDMLLSGHCSFVDYLLSYREWLV